MLQRKQRDQDSDTPRADARQRLRLWRRIAMASGTGNKRITRILQKRCAQKVLGLVEMKCIQCIGPNEYFEVE